MIICSCTKGLEEQNKRILVRTHSSFYNAKVLPSVYCIECGNQSINHDNSLIIDIEDFNVPLHAVIVEFSIVKDYFTLNSIAYNSTLMYNIMYGIIWAYEVDYYERFDNYFFIDVRNAIIDFFVSRAKYLNTSFFNNERNYEAYLEAVSNTLASGNYEAFDLESALNDPNVFTSSKHTLYGPASLIHNEYTTPLGITKKSNNFYYPNDKYFRKNYDKLSRQAEIIYLSLKQALCAYLVKNCKDFPKDLYFKTNSIKELKSFITVHNYGKNRVILTGFLEVFKEILENADLYLNLTSRTYSDCLYHLDSFNTFASEHLM